MALLSGRAGEFWKQGAARGRQRIHVHRYDHAGGPTMRHALSHWPENSPGALGHALGVATFCATMVTAMLLERRGRYQQREQRGHEKAQTGDNPKSVVSGFEYPALSLRECCAPSVRRPRIRHRLRNRSAPAWSWARAPGATSYLCVHLQRRAPVERVRSGAAAFGPLHRCCCLRRS